MRRVRCRANPLYPYFCFILQFIKTLFNPIYSNVHFLCIFINSFSRKSRNCLKRHLLCRFTAFHVGQPCNPKPPSGQIPVILTPSGKIGRKAGGRNVLRHPGISPKKDEVFERIKVS